MKTCTLNINETKKTVSLDRLKTAYVDDTIPSTDDTTKDQRPSPTTSRTSPAKTTPTVTRSGIRVH